MIWNQRIVREVLAILAGVGYAVALSLVLFNIQGRLTIESTDAFTYADTARQIAAGKGVSTAIIQPHVTTPTMPQVTWPPFFPLLVAVPLLFGVDLAQALSTTPVVVLAFCSAIVLWYVVRRWGMLPALVFATFSLTATPILHVAAQPMTEAVFMGLSLAIALTTFLLAEGTTGKQTLVLGLLLGLLLAAAGLTRYLGFAFAPAVFLWLLIRKRLPALLATVAGFFALAVPFLIRNFLLFREFANQRFPADQSLIENLRDGLLYLGRDFVHYLLWPRLTAFAVVALLVLGWVVLRRGRPILDGGQRSGLRLSLTLAGLGIVYFLGMAVTRSFVFFDRLVTRFVVPVEWLLLLAVCLALAALVRPVRWASLLVGLAVAVLAVRFIPHLYEPPAHPRLAVSGPRVAWAAATIEPKALILSNHAHAYNFFLNRTGVVLREYRSPGTVEELHAWGERWRGKFSHTYLVLSDDLSPERHTPIIVALSRGEQVPEFLEKLEATPRGIVAYRFRK